MSREPFRAVIRILRACREYARAFIVVLLVVRAVLLDQNPLWRGMRLNGEVSAQEVRDRLTVDLKGSDRADLPCLVCFLELVAEQTFSAALP